MSGIVQFDATKASPFLKSSELEYMEPAIAAAHRLLETKQGQGSDYTGWVDLPITYDRAEFERIEQAAAKINADSDVLVVVGIGGSYLGARAAIDFVGHTFHNQLGKAQRCGPQIYYAGNNLSGRYLKQLLEVLDGKDVSVNVISKSGTTTEPAVAFRFLRSYMEKRYGRDGAQSRIYVTTDRTRGALKQLATDEGYQTFVVPDDAGGRYSVLTAVGLLPIAAAGIDIRAMMAGAAQAQQRYSSPTLAENPCYQYVAARHALHRKGKSIELLVNYEPSLHYFSEWWKQLFGESEGKDGKGLFPASVDFSTDLHSMGQYIQEGVRHLFETVIHIEQVEASLVINSLEDDGDGLNFLAGKTIDYVNKRAFEATMLAHTDGGVPNLVVTAPDLSAQSFGQLVYFFEKACGVSGYVLGVNPFDQPGVEAYKQNMFALLGKPGYEAERDHLIARLQK